MPKKCGSATISGSRNMICLVRERKVPLYAFPMELKNIEEIGCKKFNQVKKQEGSEIVDTELKIFFASASEQTKDLSREKLEQQKGNNG